MKKLTVLLLLLTTTWALAWNQTAPLPVQSCQPQAPYGFAQTAKKVVAICRTAYVTAYDPAAKIPVWTSYTLTPQHALGCVARSNAFAADASVPDGATPSDYSSTGYDRGHSIPDGDMSWNPQVELESFLMTNMLPQTPYTNRSIVKSAETTVRAWAVQLNQPFVVYGGGLYNAKDPVIGRGIVVPHAFFKIAINTQTNQVVAWIFPNVDQGDGDITKLRVTVAQIQKLSGITFAFPKNAQELAPGREWPVNFGALTNAKRAVCGANATVD